MKLVYVAGPYRARTAWRVERNVRRAEELALHLNAVGFSVICPHSNNRYFQGELDNQHWLDACLEMVRRCDAVVCTEAWSRSNGTVAEIRLALELGIPVFAAVPGSPPEVTRLVLAGDTFARPWDSVTKVSDLPDVLEARCTK